MTPDIFCRSDRSTTQRNVSTIVFVAISFCCGSTFADDWATLFDGKSLDGWKPSRDNTQFALADGVIVGSAFVKRIAQIDASSRDDVISNLREFAAAMITALS